MYCALSLYLANDIHIMMCQWLGILRGVVSDQAVGDLVGCNTKLISRMLMQMARLFQSACTTCVMHDAQQMHVCGAGWAGCNCAAEDGVDVTRW